MLGSLIERKYVGLLHSVEVIPARYHLAFEAWWQDVELATSRPYRVLSGAMPWPKDFPSYAP
jgi:hypothetical protein